MTKQPKVRKPHPVLHGIGLVLSVTLLVAVLVGTYVLSTMATIIDSFIGAPSGHYSDAEIADTKVKAEALAADVEAEGTVLVQNNDNTLPLAADNKKVNVFGWASTAWLGGGSGSGGVSGVNTDLLAALTAYGVAYNTELTDMYKDFQDGREYTRTLSAWPEQSGRLYEPDINNQTYYTQSMLDNAKSFSDTAVVVIGRLAGESNDATKQQYKRTEKGGDIVVDDTRTMLELTTEEENLLNYVGANYAHVVVLINSTNVMELGQTETIPGIDACLIAGLSGSEGATAVPEVLWGDREPSGRTADTWAYDLTTAASYANAGMEGVGKYSDADGLYPADGTTRAVAMAASPSSRPVKPSRSDVVAATETGQPAARLSASSASCRRGEKRGRCPISCTATLPGSKPAARTIAAASDRIRTPEAPAISGRSVPKLEPRSPHPAALKRASAAAWATTSPSECPDRPRSPSHSRPARCSGTSPSGCSAHS